MTWTNDHQLGFEHSINSQDFVPHASVSHNSFVQSLENVVQYVIDNRGYFDVAFLTGSIAGILFHHHFTEQDARQMSLKISQHFHDAHTLFNAGSDLYLALRDEGHHETTPKLDSYWSGLQVYRSRLS